MSVQMTTTSDPELNFLKFQQAPHTGILATAVEGSRESSGLFQITLEEDGLDAYLITAPPRDGLLRISEQAVRGLMARYGITYGIVDNCFNNIPLDRKGRTLVASGRPALPGADARVVLYFQDNTGAQETEPHGAATSVDHRERQTFFKVKPGAVIAAKSSPAGGVDGITVTGAHIPAPPGRDVLLIPGQNASLSDDGHYLIATSAGVVRQENLRFDVVNLHEIGGDVDFSTGNIDFEGCVLVRGNVLPGFKVIATESVEVFGNVDRGIVEAGGDVRVHKGIYGGEGAHIKCCGSLRARSLENADVRIMNHIEISKYIINSNVLAGGNVKVMDQIRGRISGGRITAGGHVDVYYLGAPSYVQTIVDMGRTIHVGDNKTHYFNMTRFYTESLEKVNINIARIRRYHLKNTLNHDELKALHYLENKAMRYRESIRDLIRQHSSFDVKKKDSNDSEVRIHGIGFSGVQVLSVKNFMDIREDVQNAIIRDKHDGMAVLPLE